MVDFAELDDIAAEYWQPGGQPGLVFGVVRDGELVHCGGFGQRFLGGPAPDADTVFRISSMTKSLPPRPSCCCVMRACSPWTIRPGSTCPRCAAGRRSPRTRAGSRCGICSP